MSSHRPHVSISTSFVREVNLTKLIDRFPIYHEGGNHASPAKTQWRQSFGMYGIRFDSGPHVRLKCSLYYYHGTSVDGRNTHWGLPSDQWQKTLIETHTPPRSFGRGGYDRRPARLPQGCVFFSLDIITNSLQVRIMLGRAKI